MTKLFLVRHGQTEWNKAHRMQGRQDSPLTTLGVSQAESAARELESVCFDAAYCSPALRAVRTASIILDAHRIKAVVCEDFAEIALGEWEGASYDQDNTTQNPQRHNFWFKPHNYDPQPHGGEGFTEVRERALSGISNVLAANKGAENIIIVAHTVTIRTVLNHFINRPLNNFWNDPKMPPCSISILDACLDGGRLIAEVISYAGTDSTADCLQ